TVELQIVQAVEAVVIPVVRVLELETSFQVRRGVEAPVGTEQQVRTSTPRPTATFVIASPFDPVVQLVHLVLVGTVSPSHRTVEAVRWILGVPSEALVQPPAHLDLAAFFQAGE